MTRVRKTGGYARLAQRGRANLYVAERRLPEALKLYEQLANVEDAETDLQLSGIAGEAVVYHRYMQTEQDRQALEWLDKQVIERLIRLRNETNLDNADQQRSLAKEVRQLIEEYSAARRRIQLPGSDLCPRCANHRPLQLTGEADCAYRLLVERAA